MGRLPIDGGRSGVGFNSNRGTAAVPGLAGFATSGPAAGLGAVIGFGTTSRKNLNLALSLSEINTWSKTVASPRVIVNNKKTAKISDGQTRVLTAPAGANSSGSLEEVQAKLTLDVTPQVTSSGAVVLQVKLDKDDFSGAEGGATNNKSIETDVLVDSGTTLVLGGVYQYAKTLNKRGIPLLKDLPFIGQLFRLDGDTEDKNELMVFISPQILDPNNPDLGQDATESSAAL